MGWHGLNNQLEYSYIRFNGEEIGTVNVATDRCWW